MCSSLPLAWAILLRNSSDALVSQSTAVDFLETIEALIVSNATSPVVRNRLLHVLRDAVHNHPTIYVCCKTRGFLGYGLPLSLWMPLTKRARVEGMLTRSRSCLLSIQMNQWKDEETCGSQRAELLAAVFPHCVRWEYGTLHLSETPLPSNPESTPLLHQLGFWIYPRSSPAIDVAFSGLPPLPFYAQLFSTIWTLPTSHYHVADPAASLFLELYLHSELIDDMDITLPCVREFMLKDSPSSPTFEIPERFLGTTPIETLAAFISTSGCELQEVRVTEKRVEEEKCPLPHTARHFLQFQFSLPKIRTIKNSEEPEGDMKYTRRYF
ncbi:hypothetical protein DFH09DRAFT_1070184 [Mycena vulgaris]|nr:hypothetical protein DFH09DRAFT_1070184 [Mycena vulgaris]